MIHNTLRAATYALLLMLCAIAPSLKAQQIGKWKIFPAYTICTQNIPVGSRVYALMESNLMAYDTEDESLKTWDWMNGLSDVDISFMNYSKEAKRLILVYDNGNIDLLSTEDDDDIINLSQLKNSTMQRKEVNSVNVSGNKAYLSTGFGVVVVDMSEAVITNTYQLGVVVSACTTDGEYIYAGSADGMLRGRISDNLQDKANWTNINANLKKPDEMVYFDDHIFVQAGRYRYTMSNDGAIKSATSAVYAPTYCYATENVLIFGNSSTVEVYTTWDQYKTYSGTYSWKWLTYKNKTYWASDDANGLQAYTLADDGTFTLSKSKIHPNSPLRNHSFHLAWEGQRLTVAGGTTSYKSAWRPGTAIYMEPDGTWENFDESSVYSIDPNALFRNVTNIAQDPNDATRHFVSTSFYGLYEFKNGKCVKHYSCDNSPLKSILPNDAHPGWYTVAMSAQYDAEGNLWLTNTTAGAQDTTIRIILPNGKWTGLAYPELKEATALDNFLFDSKGRVWLNSRRVSSRGIFFLDYNGTLTRTTDDKHILRGTITNQDGTTYSPDEFYCVAEDREGNIWIGTNEGPFVITDPDNFTSSSFTFEQVKVARTDGSGLADYLLTGIPVNSIVIDGGNRKWFGTQNNGVYLISADSQEEIYHFTTDNSPLPSNDVNHIAINPTTGEVFFATDNGLCSFVAEATEPLESLDEDEIYAYPNPVEPDYNGPIVVRGLMENTEVKIISSSGQLIWSGTSTGGTFTWNGCNRAGRRVASGIYTIMANTPKGDKAVSTRIAIIR